LGISACRRSPVIYGACTQEQLALSFSASRSCGAATLCDNREMLRESARRYARETRFRARARA